MNPNVIKILNFIKKKYHDINGVNEILKKLEKDSDFENIINNVAQTQKQIIHNNILIDSDNNNNKINNEMKNKESIRFTIEDIISIYERIKKKANIIIELDNFIMKYLLDQNILIMPFSMPYNFGKNSEMHELISSELALMGINIIKANGTKKYDFSQEELEILKNWLNINY